MSIIIPLISYLEEEKVYEFFSEANELLQSLKTSVSFFCILSKSVERTISILDTLFDIQFTSDQMPDFQKESLYLIKEPIFSEKNNILTFIILAKLDSTIIFSLINIISRNLLLFTESLELKELFFLTMIEENLISNEEKNKGFDLGYSFPRLYWILDELKKADNWGKLKENEVKKSMEEYYKEINIYSYREIEELKNKIKEKEAVKMKGKKLNGRMICSLIHSILEELNNDCVISLDNAWEYILENECIFAYNQAIDKFNETIFEWRDKDDVSSFFTFINDVKRIRDNTFETFYLFASTAENTQYYDFYKNKLIEFVEGKENICLRKNQEISEKLCHEILEDCLIPTIQILDDLSLDNLEEFFEKIENSLRNYNEKSIGEYKNEVLISKLGGIVEKTILSIVDEIQKENSNNKIIDEETKKQKKIYEEKNKENQRNIRILQEALTRNQEKKEEKLNKLKDLKEDKLNLKKSLEMANELTLTLNKNIADVKQIEQVHQSQLSTIMQLKVEIETIKKKKNKSCCSKS